MVSDPRCPHCSEKVSATATWCMHCGADFEAPVDADGGYLASGEGARLQSALESGDFDGVLVATDRFDGGTTAVGVVLGFAALVTLPIVSPPGVTLLYLAACVGIGVFAANQPTVREAIRDGGTALAVVPFVLWLLAALLFGRPASVWNLAGPIVYAGVVLFVTRKVAAE
ncbi:zinc ribbon domain-containing protein [Haloarcula marina]|uniref:zinc ribbon domain-containing protein n=1 Tax=Haloarcula marina TaxID=2961574 RepID=UPI0020B71A17|nr:zinc ribbon domain-containing protein [Halomicroarcula marina]